LAIFRKKSPPAEAKSGKVQGVARRAFCRICEKPQEFSTVWLRTEKIGVCEVCGLDFAETHIDMYARSAPICHRCGEYLEHPGFEYGLCDGCGSKYELVDGVPPNLIPNRQQREEMDKRGKAWTQS